ncbi:uncharacterized protein LOC143483174 isoform X2 [Brachyhypopomus gauderio]|uniref:uncharacterized protein LOC143483174 isoform X2 n=1 Tax=Brachyhypopomus gauderio TaxID=698409 RepID=UPI004042CA59
MVVIKFVFALSILVSITVSSEVFRLMGSSVQLDVQQHGYNYDILVWIFNGHNMVVKYYSESKGSKTYGSFKGRVEFNSVTHSLTLMNLQKSDSGLYTAKASGEDVRTVAKYTLSVLDPIETPVLTAVTDHLSTDPDPCNITLTCRGHDLSVNSSCYNETCEEKEVTSPVGVTLFLSVRDSSSIICNISNPASWNMNVMEMNNLKVLCHHKVSSDVFKVVGSSVQLHMNDSKQTFFDLTWMYNRRFILLYETKSKIETTYNTKNSRMEFDTSDYSLTIKNLEKSDSGIYRAKITTDEEKVVAEYRLSVLDPAEIPVFSPVRHQQSSDTCNLTCRGHNFSIISNCYNHVCENKETSSGGHTLSMFVSGSTIICNHSNQVSWKGSTMEIKEVCSGRPRSSEETPISLHLSLTSLPHSQSPVFYCVAPVSNLPLPFIRSAGSTAQCCHCSVIFRLPQLSRAAVLIALLSLWTINTLQL